jgi:arsenate reductase (thioredoxin)
METGLSFPHSSKYGCIDRRGLSRFPVARQTMNILFLCTGNSCRSILAEATFNHLAPPGWKAMSAGSQPTGQVNPRSLALLAREGMATEGYRSKSWDNLPVTPDIVVTVCSSAAGETCPAYLGPVLRTHWGVDDPAHATGTDAEIDAAFMRAYRILRARIEAFLALPLESLRQDRPRLSAELDRIGASVHDAATPASGFQRRSREPGGFR